MSTPTLLFPLNLRRLILELVVPWTFSMTALLAAPPHEIVVVDGSAPIRATYSPLVSVSADVILYVPAGKYKTGVVLLSLLMQFWIAAVSSVDPFPVAPQPGVVWTLSQLANGPT